MRVEARDATGTVEADGQAAVGRPEPEHGGVEAGAAKRADTVFLMLRDGRISFAGTADELRAADDPYLRAFLSGVLPAGAAVGIPPETGR